MAFFLQARNLSSYIQPHTRGPRWTSQSLAGFSPHNVLCVHAQLRLTLCPWAVAHQALLSMEFSRQKYRSGLPFPSPGDLPDPGIEPRSPELQADSLPSEPPGMAQYREVSRIWHQWPLGLARLHYLLNISNVSAVCCFSS